MPVSTPNGYLDFTNATPRATKVIATSNVGVGFNNPLHALDVAGTANVGALTATSVGVPDLTLATLAANLVTYDSSTGVFQDSGGLFSNKLAVVSEQPPSALSGASTTVEKHGVYKVTASTGTPQNAFDKATGTSWVGSSSYTGGSGTGVYVGSTRLATGLEQGDWLVVEFPYKATLRHLTFTAADAPTGALPNKANLYATNDSLVWTELKNWESNENTIVVNASTAYKKFALVTTKTRDLNSTLEIGQLKLFCESFSVDGGKIEMATSAVTGGETVMDQTTGHTREPVVLKKYPEVAFAEGKFEYNHDSNTYTQGGYTVSGSSSNAAHTQYRAFDGDASTFAHTGTGDSFGGTDNAYDGTNSLGGISGYWHKLQLPYKIKLNQVKLRARSGIESQAPEDFTLIGSNDDTNWTTIQAFTGQTPAASGGSYYDITSNPIPYKYLALVTTKTVGSAVCSFAELEYYGYEERNTTGDLSLDTTITSKYNTPDLTNASLYLDGLKGSTATDYSGNELSVTENNVNWDSTEKSWTLSGAATSNIVTADLGWEGDQPHSVSAWVKADVLGYETPLFHVGTAEGEGDAASRVGFVDDSHISWGGEDHFFSNAEWHNVTYTYNGEGSDKKLYLDGRLVGTAANEDTFGEYPPFAMSTYSEYGYTVSENHPRTNYENPYALFDNDTGDDDASPYEWWSTGDVFSSDGQTYTGGDSIGGHSGAYVKLELPHKLKLAYVAMWPRDYGNNTTPNPQCPKDFKFIASNDNVNWDLLYTETGFTDTGNVEHDFVINSQTGYKYYAMVISKVRSTTLASICELKLYGHRENDLVRFPDPTNVLKYPHVAMTGPAQRGYVATASDQSYRAYLAFDENLSSEWKINNDSGFRYDTNGDATTSATLFESNRGEWIKLELPRKIIINSVKRYSTNSTRRPISCKLYGSNDDSTWTQLGSDITFDNTDWASGTINASTAYRYVLLQVLSISGSGQNINLLALEYYGTEEDSDVVARVGDGYDGKVRNLRVFSTALSQDRVQEIFDADKDEFGLAKSSVSVYRGHLGIGTTEPKAALTVMDEVGELEEFPPRAMTADETYIDGHGVFRASASYTSPDSNMLPSPWKAFSKDTETQTTGWLANNDYNAVTGSNPGEYGGTHQLASSTPVGHWLAIELPHKIKLNKYALKPWGIANRYGVADYPKTFYIYGSNDGSSWELVDSHVNTSDTPAILGAAVPSNETIYYNVTQNGVSYYDRYAIVITKINSEAVYAVDNTIQALYAALGEWRLFGTREQGASTLHNGELTLTRNLTVPRIGPALDADDTPRRDRLVVEYNTFENPTENGAVKDTSGRGLDGILLDNTYYDATDKALVFDGTNDYIEMSKWIHNTGFVHSFSGWIKFKSPEESWNAVYGVGNNTGSGRCFTIYSKTESNYFRTESDGGGGYIDHTFEFTGNMDTWLHIAVVKTSAQIDSTRIYINGNILPQTGGSVATNNIALPNTPQNFRLGSVGSSLNYFANMNFSNIKIYDVALTADEVKRLYDMGRLGNVIAQPLYITAPLHAPGTIIQVQYTESNTKQTITATSVQAIPSLTINFTPKFSNSKLLLKAIVSCNASYVSGFGFIKDGTTVYSGNDSQTNGPDGTIMTFYEGEDFADRVYPVAVEYMIYPGTTNTMTLSPAAAKNWVSTAYNLIINDRSNDDMRSLSTFTVYEIAQ